MAISGYPIYLSTMLLEKNRSNGKGPSLLVSEWMERIGEAGFAGVEIWMNHLQLASRSEWDLIREKAGEADLSVACIAASVPADASEKSRRMRDAIAEACDYFGPPALKCSLKGPAAAALDYLKTWSRDVPRDVTLLYDAPVGESGASTLEAARKALAGGRFKAVLHPFLMPPQELEAALGGYGDFIGNLGLQIRKGTAWSSLGESLQESLKVIGAARAKGYKGTWTAELTRGAGEPGENMDRLFDSAEEDLNFLLEALATGAATLPRAGAAPRRRPAAAEPDDADVALGPEPEFGFEEEEEDKS